MICVLALIVFGILGIFSASQRKIAAEAFDCVFRRVTFRKCTTGLDKRLKGQIIGKLMKKSPKTAKALYKNFELISWLFTLLLLASLAYSAYGAYNFVVFGNCNGPNSDGFCLYDSLAGDPDMSEIQTGFCAAPSSESLGLSTPDFRHIENAVVVGREDAPITFIEFGCYACPNTRKAYPTVEKIRNEYGDKMKFVFLHMPIPSHGESEVAILAAMCANKYGKFWEYYHKLFEDTDDLSKPSLEILANEVGISSEEFNACFEDESLKKQMNQELTLGLSVNIRGVPTFFINDEYIEGPQAYRKFKAIIDSELEK